MIDPIKITEECYNRLPVNLKKCPWIATDHGRAVLQTEEQLDAYLAAYGEMHIVKCRAALQNFPCTTPESDINRYNYEIFDWGCGQGIGTLTLLEFLNERGLLGRLNAITLIEPSTVALNRAKRWVEQTAGPGVDVKAVNKFIPNDNNAALEEVSCSARISINLFSNILDIESLSLAWLARKTGNLAGINYMICVGPKFSDNTRIKDFCGYFAPSSYFSNIESYPYAYTQRTNHPYSCETKCFVHRQDEAISINYVEQATPQRQTDDYEYAIECYRGIVDDKTLEFYNKIKCECSSAYTVFFRPNIGVDTPDVVLTDISRGIVLINICKDINKIEAEFRRVENIKSYLFSTHLKTIKIDSIINQSVYGCVKTALFFPNSSQREVEEKLNALNDKMNENSENNKDYFAYLIRLYFQSDFKTELNYISSRAFRFDYYDELLKIITGHWHSYKDGNQNFHLTDRQRDIVRHGNPRLRVKGVAGCGKTQVVANRAVERHLQTGESVLILTFNISLIQYVRMRINQVPADFSTAKFEITNYHQFFLSMANKYSDKRIALSDFDEKDFFAPYADEIKRYKTILIDEVQDFKTNWLHSIIHYFLAPDGTISVFGDGEQNIYEREMEQETKMPEIPTFAGRWNSINERISMRIINPEIARLSYRFAQRYIDDAVEPLNVPNDILFETFWIKYWNVGIDKQALQLSQNIKWIMGRYGLNPKDVVVLSESINILRDIEKCYVDAQTHSMTNFETADQYAELRRKQLSPALFHKDLKEIRRAAKTHFTTDCDCIKLSTIHSFKGWESKNVILILQPEMHEESMYEGYSVVERENTPALIYTALTRAQCNLFIINLGNQKYHSFFQNNIN